MPVRAVQLAVRFTVGGALLFAAATPLAPAQALGPGLAARAGECTVTLAEFDELAMNRHALSEDGRAALEHLLRGELLDQLALESGLTIPDADVDLRMRELDQEIRSAGDPSGLQGQLAEFRVDRATFRRFLRLQIVQEALARRALGIPRPGRCRPISRRCGSPPSRAAEARITRHRPTPPGTAGWPRAAATLQHLEVRRRISCRTCARQLDPETVREDCHQLLLEQRLRARMPDLAPEALRAGGRGRARPPAGRVRGRPQVPGPLLRAGHGGAAACARRARRAIRRRDRAALARLWVDRTHGEDGLRADYQTERAQFDARFGDALERTSSS